MAAGTCISAGSGALDSTVATAPWQSGGTGTGCAANTVAAPDSTNNLSIRNVLTPPSAAVVNVNYIDFSNGDLSLTGKTLNVMTLFKAVNGTTTIGAGGTLSVGGNITFGPAPAGTIILNGGTLIVGAHLDTGDVSATFTTTSGTVKLTDANHDFTLYANQTFAVMDASLLTGATGAGKIIGFVGGFNHTISSLTIPTAAAAAKEIKFVVPPNQTLTISAITGNTMTCTGTTVGGTAAAPVFTAGGSAATITCATGITATPPPTAPSGLSASVASATQINLTWTDASSDETGFKIFNGATLLTTTAAGTTSYSATGLTCNTAYTFTVKATNANGDSTAAVTSPATTTTSACSTPVNAPVDLRFSKQVETFATEIELK